MRNEKEKQKKLITSAILPNGIAELIYNSTEEKTEFALFDGKEVIYTDELSLADGSSYSFPEKNHLIVKGIIVE